MSILSLSAAADPLKVDRVSSFSTSSLGLSVGGDFPAVELGQYSVDAFNGLEHIHDASHHEVDAHANTLGALILQYGLEDHCGVWRVHKHWNLGQDERVVGRFGTGTTAKANAMVLGQGLDDSATIINIGVETDADGGGDMPFGTHFRLQDGICQPMQFMHGGALGDLVRANQSAVLEKEGFIAQYAAVVAALGMADKIGLYIVYEDALPGSHDGVLEDTTEEDRTQTLCPVLLGGTVYPGNSTGWRFEKGGLQGVAIKKHTCCCSWRTPSHC
jgi:hypothetical protein